MLRKLIGACVGLAMMGMAGTANALLMYQFEGVVNLITSDQTGQISADGIVVGTTFSGTFEYDPNAASTFDGAGFSNYPGISININLDTGSSATSGTASIQINNDSGAFGDRFSIFTTDASSANFSYSNFFLMQIQLFDFTQSLYNSTILPAGLDFSDFNSTAFTFQGQNLSPTQDDRFNANLTSLTLVPEPSTLALFATGLALLAFLGWRRRKSVQVKAA